MTDNLTLPPVTPATATPTSARAKHFGVTSGTTLRCRGWRQEGLLRLLENVLSVGEAPEKLIVYAALGRAARDWPSHDRIVETLRTMHDDETLIVQSGKPIGLVKTHANAPIVVMANCNIVGQWAKAEQFYELEKKGLICWGGLTAGDWQYIGSQGVIQGTYEIFMRIAESHFGGDLAGGFILTAGLGHAGPAAPQRLLPRTRWPVLPCSEVIAKIRPENRLPKRGKIHYCLTPSGCRFTYLFVAPLRRTSVAPLRRSVTSAR